MGRYIESESELEDLLTTPSPSLISDMTRQPDGDLVVLGAGGKMGPSLAILAQRAASAAGLKSQVYAVSRFSNQKARDLLDQAGVITVAFDLLQTPDLRQLPDASQVVFMAGQKFGTADEPPLTWALNTYLPARVAERYADSKLVAFSTGNVYPLTPAASGGSVESDPLMPIGEYAQSCLGRERILTYFSNHKGTQITILRLNYAIDLRYGVLLDLAQKVDQGIPIDLQMGNVNLIWQGDANEMALRTFSLCTSPPQVLNLTGPETISIRLLAHRLGQIFNQEPIFINTEGETSFLNNASRCHQIFSYPRVPLGQMIDWVAHWVKIGGPTLDKPTHFEVRTGTF